MSRQEIMAELREWKQLLDDGLVTEEEFQTHRQQLMAQLKQHSVSSSPGASSPAAPSGASFFGTGGVVPEVSAQGQVDQVLAGRYRLDALLGVGGMGEVYKATDTLSNTVCALKWIRPELADNEQLRQRFVNELQVTQRLTHPGIVRTYALAQDRERGALFFTMEYVEGESLEDLLNHAEAEGRVPPVPVEKALEWLKTLAEALAVAHEEGILHRDLKPANIMVDQRGRLRLMDFGIAKAVGQVTQLHTGYVGTPVYMPPEQLRGGKATPASDLYSFGVLMYQTLTGDLPQGRFEEPCKLVPELPGWADLVVMKCLASRAENRYQQVSELLADWGETEKTTPTTRRGERAERAQATSSQQQQKSAFKPKSLSENCLITLHLR